MSKIKNLLITFLTLTLILPASIFAQVVFNNEETVKLGQDYNSTINNSQSVLKLLEKTDSTKASEYRKMMLKSELANSFVMPKVKTVKNSLLFEVKDEKFKLIPYKDGTLEFSNGKQIKVILNKSMNLYQIESLIKSEIIKSSSVKFSNFFISEASAQLIDPVSIYAIAIIVGVISSIIALAYAGWKASSIGMDILIADSKELCAEKKFKFQVSVSELNRLNEVIAKLKNFEEKCKKEPGPTACKEVKSLISCAESYAAEAPAINDRARSTLKSFEDSEYSNRVRTKTLEK
jgi:hypothetical protein